MDFENKLPTYWDMIREVKTQVIFGHKEEGKDEITRCHEGEQCIRADGVLCVKFTRVIE